MSKLTVTVTQLPDELPNADAWADAYIRWIMKRREARLAVATAPVPKVG